MKKLWWMILPVFVIAGLGVWWFAMRHLESKPRTTAEHGPSDQNLARRLAALEAENKHVRRDLALTRMAMQSASGENNTAETKPNTETAEHDSSQGKTEQTSLKERQRVAMENLEEELHARAAAEPPDRTWTTAVERSLRAKLATFGHRVSLESARCGSSLCTVVISHESSRAHVDLATALRMESAPGFGGQFLVRRHPNPAGGYRTTLFLPKDGERIPDLNEAISPR